MKRNLQCHLLKVQRNTGSPAGFTLTEVIVVIVMALALAAIAAPSWVALLNRQRLSSATTDVLQALRQAQDEAVRTRYPKQVTFDGASSPPTVTVLGEVRIIGQGNTGVTLAATPNTITFGATGGPIVSPQDVTPATNLPISIALTSATGSRRCVVVETLLGAMRTANRGENGCS